MLIRNIRGCNSAAIFFMSDKYTFHGSVYIALPSDATHRRSDI